jgi:23S rRNA pseudouridine1911/1915/1917 synthase
MNFGRQALHAHEIGFIHPVSGEDMSFSSALPEDLQNLKNLFESIG